MENNKDKGKDYSIGCIIGRFQIHRLHEAHRELIDTVISRHNKVIIFLGVSPVLGSTRNPLDFTSRKKMIQEEYPDVVVMSIPDKRNDEAWSKNIDTRIREVYPMGHVLLYGGRDSFLPHYMGGFDTTELEQTVYVSGTEIRKQISEEIKSSEDWRAGVIYDAYNRYPVSFQTVDIAAMSSDGQRLLLAKKPGESAYRFIGGFVDPSDISLEHAARREFMEETGGAEINGLTYFGSWRIEDWRYRNEESKIMSALFIGTYTFGSLRPSDDISELKWFHMKDLCSEGAIIRTFVKEHEMMAIALIGKYAASLEPSGPNKDSIV
jgi:bifunctional NMN adenylyltransferase/nudix hydrolase